MASPQECRISRRQMVKAFAGTTGAMILAGCTPTPAPTAKPTQVVAATKAPEATKPPEATKAPAATAVPQPTAAPRQPITVTWWHAQGAEAGKSVEEIAKRFNESQKVVTVKTEYQGDYRTLEQKLAAAIAAKATPEILTLAENGYMAFALNGTLEVLDELAASPTGVDLKGYYPVLSRGRQKGKLYQLPFCVSTPVLYYNEEMLKKAGLDGPPKTWDDLHKIYLPKLTIKEGGKTKIHAWAWRSPGFWWQQAYLWAHGLEICDKDYRVHIDSPEFIAFLTRWQGEFKAGYAYAPTTAEGGIDGYYASGNAAMMIQSSASMTAIDIAAKDKVEVKVSFLPQGPAGKAASNGGNGISLVAGLNAQRREAGWEFVRYTQQPEPIAINVRFTGYVPYTEGATAVMVADMAQDPRRKVSVEQLTWARNSDEIVRFARTQTPLVDQTNNAVRSNDDPTTVAKKLQKEITDILKEEGLAK